MSTGSGLDPAGASGDLRDHVAHIGLAVPEIPDLSLEERAGLVGRIREFVDGRLAPHLTPANRRAVEERSAALGAVDLGDTPALQESLAALAGRAAAALSPPAAPQLDLGEDEPVLRHDP